VSGCAGWRALSWLLLLLLLRLLVLLLAWRW